MYHDAWNHQISEGIQRCRVLAGGLENLSGGLIEFIGSMNARKEVLRELKKLSRRERRRRRYDQEK